MTSRTAWAAGLLNSGLGWTTAINSVDMASMTNTETVVSSVADITNGTSLDIFVDISFSLVRGAGTPSVGANIAFWLYGLNQDGSTYGDSQFTNGTAASLTPAFPPCAILGLPATSGTTLTGTVTGIIIPPGSFRFAMQNNSGFTLTSGTQTVKYRSYNTNLNS